MPGEETKRQSTHWADNLSHIKLGSGADKPYNIFFFYFSTETERVTKVGYATVTKVGYTIVTKVGIQLLVR